MKESGAIPNSFSNRIVNNLSNFFGSLQSLSGRVLSYSLICRKSLFPNNTIGGCK